jgi:pilus assembly protein CpaE
MSLDDIAIASRNVAAADAVRALIGEVRDMTVRTHVIDPRQTEPFTGLGRAPDVLVLRVGADSIADLEALGRISADKRPSLIVIGDAANTECMRVAMRIGARDFLVEPLTQSEVLAAIKRVAGERRARQRTAAQCRTIAFMNAKGGSGATFIACNVAHMFTSVSNLRTVLVDLDSQFGTLTQYLDLRARAGLLEACDVASELDAVALDGYLTKHGSGLAVLAALPDSGLPQRDSLAQGFEAVLRLLAGNFERVVIDLPNHIDALSAAALERADTVVVVLQQTVPSLHNAVRMFDLLTRGLGVPLTHIEVVVNRYRKNAAVEIPDVRQALQGKEPTCVPNDYAAVTESIDMGVPIYDGARRSATTKALLKLEHALGGHVASVSSKGGLLPRLLRTG